MKILVVDDDPDGLEMISFALSHFGYEVFTASNGREALARLNETGCRLVISDWMMPEMTGIELCRAVRDGEFNGYIYFILLTSRDGSDDVVEGMSAGADDFIVKPFEPAELKVRIRAGERILGLETRDLMIFALAKLAEARDPETGAHLERVQRYSRVLAQQLADQPFYARLIDNEFIRLIYLTSPLHDIGKVGIPDHVLLKPGRLTVDEFEIMKRHTTIGAKTLDAALAQNPSASFLCMARDIAASHHEWYDGTGYPSGLAGDQIPLSARIVALADVYDALTSKRVYKAAFDDDLAHDTILQGRGTHFDPDIVDAFLQTEELFQDIRARYHGNVLVPA
jgi:putative two-component system response regulator